MPLALVGMGWAECFPDHRKARVLRISTKDYEMSMDNNHVVFK